MGREVDVHGNYFVGLLLRMRTLLNCVEIRGVACKLHVDACRASVAASATIDFSIAFFDPLCTYLSLCESRFQN